MAEFTDAEVFGAPPSAPPPTAGLPPPRLSSTQELTDEDVFKPPPVAQPSGEATDAQVFGTEAPPPSKGQVAFPGPLGFIQQMDVSTVPGVAKTFSSGLQGMAGQGLEIAKGQVPIWDRIDAGEHVPEIEDVLGYGQMDPAMKARMRAGVEIPLEQQPEYKAAAAIPGTVPGGEARVPGYEKAYWAPAIGEAVGSTGAGIGAGGVPWVGPLFAGAIFTGAGTDEARDRARKMGATPEQESRAAHLGSIAGAMDLVDLGIPYMGSFGAALSLFKRIGVKAFETALVEGGQEAVQELWQNATEKYLYNPNKPLMENVVESGVIGFLAGGFMGGVFAGPRKMSEASAAQATAASEHILALSKEMGIPPPRPDVVPVQTPGGYEGWTVAKIFGDVSAPTPMPPAETFPSTVTPPPRYVPKPDEVPPNVVEFLARRAPPLTPTPRSQMEAAIDPNLELKKVLDREVEMKSSVNMPNLLELIGPKLYGDPKDLVAVSIKEMLQNSHDAVKEAQELGLPEAGNIDFKLDANARTITVHDNGIGMSAEVMAGPFLEVAGSEKGSDRPGGGFGMAKALFLYANGKIKVWALHKGEFAVLETSGPELKAAAGNAELRAKIKAKVRTPTAAELAMFPSGRGTVVQVTVPKTYKEGGSGIERNIDFPTSLYSHPALRKSPLFDQIKVTFDKDELKIGSQFPITDYTHFTTVKYPWGSVRVYVTAAATKIDDYYPNAHVLSNGVWQFDTKVPKKAGSDEGARVQRRFYVDVIPEVSPRDSGYPFDINRQDFAETHKASMAQIFAYASLNYQQEEMEREVDNFGDMEKLSRGPVGIERSPTQKLVPKKPPPPTALRLIKEGEEVEVKGGKMYVKGRLLKELTPQDIEKFHIDPDTLRVDQKEIDPQTRYFHDNLTINRTNLALDPADEIRYEPHRIPPGGISGAQLGREKFGSRFDDFVYGVADAFGRLRDVVVKVMPMGTKYGPYTDMAKDGIGTSLDIEYRGVSIRIPFRGMFINPFLTEYNKDVVKASVGVVTTMIHEMAHTHIRNEEIAPEIQRILTELMAMDPKVFDFLAFNQEMVDLYNKHWDVFQYMNGVMIDGIFDIQPRGKRFKVTGSQQGADGGSFGNFVRAGLGARAGSSVLDAATGRTFIASGVSGSPKLSFTTQGTRNPDFGLGENQRALDRETSTRGDVPAVQRQPETVGPREALGKVFQATGGTPAAVSAAAAHADRINRFYKWMYDIVQLAQANPRFAPLLRYLERIKLMHTEEAKIIDAANRISKRWRGLGNEQNAALTRVIDDVTNMRYRDPKEVVGRQPTTAELTAIFRKYKLSADGIQVYRDVQALFMGFLQQVAQNAVEEAKRRIKDPKNLSDRLDEIRGMEKLISERPYFPFNKFGEFFVRKFDSAGNVVYEEAFERRGLVSAEGRQQRAFKQLNATKLPGERVEFGKYPEQSSPFLGLPPTLLQEIKSKLTLSPAQEKALDSMISDRRAGMSFVKRFTVNKTPGYSMDFRRSFARYFFHGARYYTRTKHLFALQEHIENAQTIRGDNKANKIGDFMDDHLKNTVLDVRGDYGIFKGLIFHWTMGFVPASALQNLMQTPIITNSFLSAKFGDAQAISAILRAIADIKIFYRKGGYTASTAMGVRGDFLLRALDYGIKTGRISEAQASELAGMADGGNLMLGYGGTDLQAKWQWLMEKGAWTFEMAEQFNRRVAYRAALALTLRNPNAKIVKEAMAQYHDEYQSLITAYNFTPAQAQAIITASHTVDQTQYVYARYARARFMRGKKGILLVFQKYLQATLVMLAQNPKDVLPRYLFYMFLLGGAAGWPLYEELRDIIRIIANRKFGRDFNLDKEVRRFTLNVFGDKIPPDLLLHGLSRYGFGVPAALDMMGSLFTGTPGRGFDPAKEGRNIPFPTVDMSRAVGQGHVLPIELNKLFGPSKDINSAIADTTQKASGAVFSVAFNMYKAIMDNNLAISDPKRWERAVPRMMGSASKAFRYINEGRERARIGDASAPTIIGFDAHDTEHMMEAISAGLGFQPLRLQGTWDNAIAKAEATRTYDLWREAILHDWHEVIASKGDRSLVKKNTQEFNDRAKEAGFPERQITPDTITRSVTAQMRGRILQERDIPGQKQNIGIYRDINRLYPEGTLEVRKVPTR